MSQSKIEKIGKIEFGTTYDLALDILRDKIDELINQYNKEPEKAFPNESV